MMLCEYLFSLAACDVISCLETLKVVHVLTRYYYSYIESLFLFFIFVFFVSSLMSVKSRQWIVLKHGKHFSEYSAVDTVAVCLCISLSISQAYVLSLRAPSGPGETPAPYPFTTPLSLSSTPFFKPRLHDTTCCQTGLTTGSIVYTNTQPVVKPI